MSNPSSLRKRGHKASSSIPPHSSAIEDDVATSEKSARGISFLDILRVLITLLALSLSLSYYLTSGDSLTFNYRPWFTKLDRIKAYARGPLLLSPHELSLHNGTAPLLPIYLAINSTIFDVSASPHTYGPGGSYHVFAGRDATRAFVTGCFQTDLTGDLRGVERMYLPVEDVDEGGETGKGLSSGERKIRTEQEKREARKKSRKEVEKWVRFYGDSEKYFEVGRLVGPEGEGEGAYTGEAPNLCDSAENARPKRSQLNAQAAENAGGRAGKKPLFQPQKGERGQGKPF